MSLYSTLSCDLAAGVVCCLRCGADVPGCIDVLPVCVACRLRLQAVA